MELREKADLVLTTGQISKDRTELRRRPRAVGRFLPMDHCRCARSHLQCHLRRRCVSRWIRDPVRITVPTRSLHGRP